MELELHLNLSRTFPLDLAALSSTCERGGVLERFSHRIKPVVFIEWVGRNTPTCSIFLRKTNDDKMHELERIIARELWILFNM